MRIFILLISFYSSISFGACVPGSIQCSTQGVQYIKGQTAPYATPSAGYANFYFDQSVSQGITPRWQDSLATVYPIIGKIVSNRTIYVATTGNDTTGTGLIGAPYLTPQKALDYLSNFLIAPGVEVIISLAAGQYILTSSIVPQHPQGAQITIQGANVATPPVAADFCTPNVAPACTGALPARGWTNPTAAQREAAANSDLTMLRTKFPTELRFNGNIDGIKLNGYHIKIANLLITSLYLPNTASAANQKRGIILGYDIDTNKLYNGSFLMSTGPVSVHGFGSGGLSVNRSSSAINQLTFTVSNTSGYSMTAQISSDIQNVGPLVISNNGADGLYSAYNSIIYNASTVAVSSNAGTSITAQSDSSVINSGATFTNNNGGNGLSAILASLINNAASLTSNNNNTYGMDSYTNSAIVTQGAVTVNNNTQIGMYAYQSVISNASTVSASNNGAHGIYASQSGAIYSLGPTTSSNNSTGHGIFADKNSHMTFTLAVTSTGNPGGSGILANITSSIGLYGAVTSSNNAGEGISAQSSSSVFASAAVTLQNNGGSGIYAYETSSVTVPTGSIIQNNTFAGMEVRASSFVIAYLTAANFTGNGGGNVIRATNGSNIWVASGLAGATYSPAFGVDGNSNAHIGQSF